MRTRWLMSGGTVTVFVLICRRVVIARGMRRGDQRVIDRRRERNKRLANRVVRTVGRAGRHRSPFAIVGCVGRRTGRLFETPVRVVGEDQVTVLIPLTYGPRTGWLKNLRVNEGYLLWQDRRIAVGSPEIVETDRIALDLPWPSRLLLWLDGTTQLVRLTKASDPPAPIHAP